MDYNANTDDVTKYLVELKQYIFSVGDSADTGTANLIVLLNGLKQNLSYIKQRVREEIKFLSTRYAIITRTLSQLETSKKYQDNIDYRYGFYKNNTQNIVTFSPFMTLINFQLDDIFDHITEKGIELRREKHALELTISHGTTYLTFLDEIEPEIDNLISKCENT